MWRGGAGEIDWEGFKSFRRSGGGAGQAGSSASRSSLSARPCVAVLSLFRMFLFCVFACLFYRESLLACQAFAALAMLPFVCVNASACLGLWGCGLVSSPSVVPVRCLRAVNTVESSQSIFILGSVTLTHADATRNQRPHTDHGCTGDGYGALRAV